MCLLFFSYRSHPRIALLLAANRDEFYARATAPLAPWDDRPDVIAGRDLVAGGTWLGVTRTGRLAAITNYRDPRRSKRGRSRGAITREFLTGHEPVEPFLERLVRESESYDGFNLIVGEHGKLHYHSNVLEGSGSMIEPGVHSLSNHLLDTPWPKTERAKQALKEMMTEAREPSEADLLALLTDRTIPADELLPDTGVGLLTERELAPVFVATPPYGTRSTTIVTVAWSGEAEIAEWTWTDRSVRRFRFVWPGWAASHEP